MQKTRVPNWPLLLNQRIDEWRSRPFQWGSGDCCQFVAEMVSALSGVDHRASFPPYSSQSEAEAIVARHGGMESLVSVALGKPKPAAWAQRGDVVLADFDEGPTCGICLGVVCCAPGARGLIFRPTAIATAAWTV